ncbi:MAG: ribonuclease Y [Acidobacteria bacterium]|nr:ribonuclease Y [Acidobacteriota bacterium]
MDTLTLTGMLAGSGLLGILLGFALTTLLKRRAHGRAIMEAEEVLQQARQEAKRRQKEAALAAREEFQKARQRADGEFRRRQSNLTKKLAAQEKRSQKLGRRSEELDRRGEELDGRASTQGKREEKVGKQEAELKLLLAEQSTRLERISGIGREEARRLLMETVGKETRFEAARLGREIREEAQKQADQEAQKIMALAIERSASEFSTSRTSSTIIFPDEKVKGRLIGHEGKNIKAFEAATGMQLIIDETPGQVVISGFHPIKREIARLTLEKLIKDGNVHPRRIEETLRKMRKKVNGIMRRAAEEALKELGITRVHPEIVKLLGRLHYRTSYGQNVLQHSKEVGYLTGIMAVELGMDEKMGRRAGRLHDIGKAIDYEREGTHPEIGEEVARRYGEPDIVVNAIASHHEDCEVISPISVLVSAADALSGARPGARRRTLADFIRRVEKLEEIASSFKGVSESYAIQAGRELRVIARHQELSDEESALLASDIAHRIEAEVDYPGKIRVTVIREMWARATVH